jgi:hypothetical protein
VYDREDGELPEARGQGMLRDPAKIEGRRGGPGLDTVPIRVEWNLRRV